MKTIYNIPLAGLCNRMRSIASALFVARRLGANTIIYWNKTKVCKCKFRDLFLPPVLSGVKIVDGGYD